MTDIESAAQDIAVFLRDNCPPSDASDVQRDEWPIAITADNQNDANQLATLLQKLEDTLIERGLFTRN